MSEKCVTCGHEPLTAESALAFLASERQRLMTELARLGMPPESVPKPVHTSRPHALTGRVYAGSGADKALAYLVGLLPGHGARARQISEAIGVHEDTIRSALVSLMRQGHVRRLSAGVYAAAVNAGGAK